MQPNKISIIIACYNDHSFIDQAVESAINQTYNNKEIIIIDDGSNAQTKKALKKLESKIDLLITQENAGVSAARNNGIEAAKGDYILILDSDDYFEPTFCKKAIKILEQNKDVKVVSCYARWFKNYRNFKIHKPKGGGIKNYLISNSSIGNALFRKIDWENVGGYDEKMIKGYEDWEFFIRIHENGGFTHIIPQVLFNYRDREMSRNKKANLLKYELLEYIYLKHAGLYKEYFPLFIQEWLASVKKSEAFKQQVMDSLDYKIGYQLLRPLRYFGLFKKKKATMRN